MSQYEASASVTASRYLRLNFVPQADESAPLLAASPFNSSEFPVKTAARFCKSAQVRKN